MVSNSNEVMTSPYEVDLYYAIKKYETDGTKLSGFNVPHCY